MKSIVKYFIFMVLVMVIPITISEAEEINIHGEYDFDRAREIVNEVNVIREKDGLGSLVFDSNLTDMAMLRAREISIYYNHVRPNGLGFDSLYNELYSFKGEAIGKGYDVIDSWINGDDKDKIFSSDFMGIGVGTCLINDTYYTVAMFGDVVGDEFSDTGSSLIDGVVDVGSYKLKMNYGEEVVIHLGDKLEPGDITLVNDLFSIKLDAKNLKWESSDTDIFTVDDVGVINPIKVGNAILKISLGEYSLDYKVIVKEYSLVLDSKKVLLEVGEESKVKVVLLEDGKEIDGLLSWNSLDKNIAIVNDGVISGVKEGSVIVKVSYDKFVEEDIEVIVRNRIQSISLDKNTEVIFEGESSKFNYVIVPDVDIDEENLSYVSRNEDVAVIDDSGNVYGVSAGTTTISVVYYDKVYDREYKKNARVTVVRDNVIVNGQDNYLYVGDEMAIEAKTLSNRDDIKLYYASSNQDVAVVDENGVVRGIGAGKVRITAFTSNGLEAYYDMEIMGYGRGGDVDYFGNNNINISNKTTNKPTVVVIVDDKKIVENNSSSDNSNQDTVTTGNVEDNTKKEEEKKDDNKQEEKKEVIESDTKKEEKKDEGDGLILNMRKETVFGYGVIALFIGIGIFALSRGKHDYS